MSFADDIPEDIPTDDDYQSELYSEDEDFGIPFSDSFQSTASEKATIKGWTFDKTPRGTAKGETIDGYFVNADDGLGRLKDETNAETGFDDFADHLAKRIVSTSVHEASGCPEEAEEEFDFDTYVDDLVDKIILQSTHEASGCPIERKFDVDKFVEGLVDTIIEESLEEIKRSSASHDQQEGDKDALNILLGNLSGDSKVVTSSPRDGTDPPNFESELPDVKRTVSTISEEDEQGYSTDKKTETEGLVSETKSECSEEEDGDELRKKKKEDEETEMTKKEKEMMVAAVRSGDIDLLEDLLDKKNADMNMIWYNQNLLMTAIRAGQQEMAEFLLDNGIDHNFEASFVELEEDNSVTYFKTSCRQIAFDNDMMGIVEIIDIKNNNVFPFVKPRQREIRYRRPRPPTPPEEDSDEQLDDSQQSVLDKKDGKKKIDRDIDSGLQSMKTAHGENYNKQETNSVVDSHKEYGLDEGYATMSPKTSPRGSPMHRIDTSTRYEHVEQNRIRGTKSSIGLQRYTSSHKNFIPIGSSPDPIVHKITSVGSYANESRRWHVHKVTKDQTASSEENLPKLFQAKSSKRTVRSARQSSAVKHSTHSHSKNVSPFSQVSRVLAGSPLLTSNTETGLPSISYRQQARTPSYGYRTATPQVYLKAQLRSEILPYTQHPDRSIHGSFAVNPELTPRRKLKT